MNKQLRLILVQNPHFPTNTLRLRENQKLDQGALTSNGQSQDSHLPPV